MMEARDYIAKRIEALQNATTATEITEQADYFVNILKDIVSKTIELAAYRKLGTPEEIKAMQEYQRPLVCIRETQRATIKELEAKNERLTKQLENAVELPKPFIEEYCYDGIHKRYEVYHSRIDTFCSSCDDSFDTLEEAEARLKELQGDK